MSMHTCMPGVQRLKKASDPLELELQVIVSWHEGAEIEPVSFGRIITASNHRAIPLAPAIISSCILSTYLCTSSKKHLFGVDRDYYRNPQRVKVQRTADHKVPGPNWYSYNTTPTSKTQGILSKGIQKDCKSRGPGHLLEYLLYMTSISMKSQRYNCLNKTCPVQCQLICWYGGELSEDSTVR